MYSQIYFRFNYDSGSNKIPFGWDITPQRPNAGFGEATDSRAPV